MSGHRDTPLGAEGVLDALPDVVVRVGRDLRYRYVNAAFERAARLHAADVLGRTCGAAGEPRERCEPWERLLRRVLETGEPREAVHAFSSPHGDRHVHDVATPEMDASGALASIVLVSRDVTAVREAALLRERTLEESEREKHLLDAILAEAPVGIAVLNGADPGLRARWSNPAYLAYLEEPYRSRGLTGVPLAGFLPNAEESGVAARVRQVAATQQAYLDPEYRHVGFARGPTWWRYSLLPLPTRAPPADVMVLALDISEQVAQRARLADAIRARDEFLSIASHELRTPLTSLWLQLQLLLREVGEPGERQALAGRVDVAQRQAARLRALVESLLDVSRIHAGMIALQRDAFDLGALAHEVVERMAGALHAAGCGVAVRAEAGVVGSWDRSRVDQMLAGLLANAARHAPGADVEVRVEDAGDRARLCVRDDGPGIREDQLERIFERFERAAPGAAASGLGLGLYLVRQLAHAHGGEVFAASAPGRGAAFTIELPKRA